MKFKKVFVLGSISAIQMTATDLTAFGGATNVANAVTLQDLGGSLPGATDDMYAVVDIFGQSQAAADAKKVKAEAAKLQQERK